MRTKWRYLALFGTLAVVSGALYWLQSDESDWWAYVEDPTRGRWPKFRLTWPEQALVCAAIGSIIAAPLTGGVLIIHCVWRGLTRRFWATQPS